MMTTFSPPVPRALLLWLILISHLPAIVLALLLQTIWGNHQLETLRQNVDGFAVIAAVAACSMLGLTTVNLAMFSPIGQSEPLRRYQVNGYLVTLLRLMALTVLEIAITFCLALTLLFPSVRDGSLAWAWVALFGSFGMFLTCLTPCFALHLRVAAAYTREKSISATAQMEELTWIRRDTSVHPRRTSHVLQ